MVDAKSPWTYRHSTGVAEISVGLAGNLAVRPELMRDIRRAALLHDIGKLGVSNLILDKPGKPTPDELAQIQKHPEYSQRILEQVDAFKVLADVASAPSRAARRPRLSSPPERQPGPLGFAAVGRGRHLRGDVGQASLPRRDALVADPRHHGAATWARASTASVLRRWSSGTRTTRSRRASKPSSAKSTVC